MKAPLLFGFLSIMTLSVSGQQTPPITKGQNIFVCHHSLFNSIAPILTEVAKSGGFPDQAFVGESAIGGSKSIQHWDVPDATNKVKPALIAGKVDVLLLTPLYLPDDGIEKFAKLGFEHNPNLRVLVMEPWLPWDVYNPRTYVGSYQPIPGEPPLMEKPAKVDHNAATVEGLQKMHEYFFRTWNEHLEAINKELGKQVVFVVPAGQAVIALREKIIAGQAPGLKTQADLFADELGHPKNPLLVLETYCHYAVLYRKSPVGLPVPLALNQAGLPADQIEPLNKLLQELAWDAVIHHPLSGVVAP
jgi:hypothetical protein